MFWRVFIVLKIDEERLVWLETVPAECIGLLDPSFFRSRYFYATENLFVPVISWQENVTLKKIMSTSEE